MLEVVRSHIVDLAYLIRSLCAIELIFFIFKGMITQSRLDKVKRNMIFIKYLVINVYGLLLFVSFLIFKTSIYADYYYRGITAITAMTIFIVLALFYSGTPLIFFQKQVNYSWPIKSDWNDEWLIKYGNYIIVIWFIIVLYCDTKGFL